MGRVVKGGIWEGGMLERRDEMTEDESGEKYEYGRDECGGGCEGKGTGDG